MTPTMRIRVLWAVVALMVALGGLAAASPFLINTRVVKKQISKQISDWMGLPVLVRGEPVVTVFPYLTIKLKDVQVASHLGSNKPPLVSMQVLRAEMYWLPLILGKFEVRRFHLDNPVFDLVRNADGKASWDLTGGDLISPDDHNNRLALSDISLGNFQISSGSAHYVDETTGRDEYLSDINLAFDWPNTGETAAIDGEFEWRDQPIQLSARSDMPMELFGGGLSPLSLQVSSPLFDAQIEGTAATMSSLQLEGDFSFETKSLRDWISWLGGTVRSGESLGAASLKARSNLVGASVAFSDMALTIDNNRVDGVMQLDFRRDRPLIQGTLASDKLDLDAYLMPKSGSKALLDQSLTAKDLGLVDLDVRLSANQLALGPVKLGRTAATLVTRDRQMSFSISEAYAYGGRMEASLDIRPSKSEEGELSGHLRAKANGILAGTLAREMIGRAFLTGTALAEIDLQGEGENLGQIAQSANGDLSLVVTDGELNNFNLDTMQKALEPNGTVEPDALYNGDSAFDVLSIRGRMAEKTIFIDGLRVTSGKRALLGKAELNLSEMALDFPGTLALYRSNDPTTHSSEEPIEQFTFHLNGPIERPLLSLHKIGDVPVSENKDILVPGVPTDFGPIEKTDNPNPVRAPAPEQLKPDQTEPNLTEPVSGDVESLSQNNQQRGSIPKEAPSGKGRLFDPMTALSVGEPDLTPLKTFGEAVEQLFQKDDPAQDLSQSLLPASAGE
ncbi:AsmA family protein [Cohaesibacter celericrescens]|uniref:AsmA family protein n=1 Tax=Cohaesibacter celericrescens TaxID=2067669 RepID=UPI00356A1E65